MKIYNGIRYLTFGFDALEEHNEGRLRIERVFRPFEFFGCNFPILIKSWIWDYKIGDKGWFDEYNPEMIDWLGTQIDVKREKNEKGDLVIKCYNGDYCLGDPEHAFSFLKKINID